MQSAGLLLNPNRARPEVKKKKRARENTDTHTNTFTTKHMGGKVRTNTQSLIVKRRTSAKHIQTDILNMMRKREREAHIEGRLRREGVRSKEKQLYIMMIKL